MEKKDYDLEFKKIITEIINHPEFQKRKKFKHHGNISVYDHCLKVSYKAYKIAKFFKGDYKSSAIAGLLHDFYEHPWMENTTKKKFREMHGFTHAQNALDNAKKYFPEYLNPKIENAIKRHMFPLNIRPPRYTVGWIVTLSDKIVSFEVFKYPKQLLPLIGIKKKAKSD